jgi:hypothetical protein
MDGMAEEEGLVLGQRVWFSDARSPSRRLAVTTHPDAGVVVLSLWQGDRCTATFRLPLVDAEPMVDALRAGMTEMMPAPPSPSPSVLRRIK